MKKWFLVLAFVSLPWFVSAQSDEQKYYIYHIVTLHGDSYRTSFRAWVDNGETIEVMRDEQGKKITFKTRAALLMYLLNRGWELYSCEEAYEGKCEAGTGELEERSYYIFRKECSKEELERAVDRGMVK